MPQISESRLSNVPETARSVLVVTNPHAGARHRMDHVQRLISELARRRLDAELITDLEPLVARVDALQAAGRLRAVVAAGGDGTVAEIVNRTASNVPVAVFPLGTANLLAGHFGIRADPVAFAQTIDQGATLLIDAGRANGRVFLLMAGCGYDADVVHRIHRHRQGNRINQWSYFRPILESIRGYSFPELRVYCQTDDGGGEESWTARWAFVVNLPRYAGRLRFAPTANATDGLLDVCTFQRGSLGHGFRYVMHAWAGRPHWSRDFRTRQVRRVRIEADEQVPFQLDGDPGGHLPLQIEVLPGRCTMIYPVGAPQSASS